MRGSTVVFRLPVCLHPDAVGHLELIPGVQARKSLPGSTQPSITCPWHAGSIVSSILQSWKLNFSTEERRPAPLIEGVYAGQVVPPDRIPGLKPEARLTEFQRELLPFHQEMLGGLVHWACGSGKTFFGLLWGLSCPGRIIVVTRSATVPQWASELNRRFEGISIGCLYGQAGFEIRKIEPASVWRTHEVTVEKTHQETVHRVVYAGAELETRLQVLALREEFERWANDGQAQARKRLTQAGVIAEVQEDRKAQVKTTQKVRETEGRVVWRVWSNDGERYVAEYESQSEAIGDLNRRALTLDVPRDTRILAVGWAVLAKRLPALLAWRAPTLIVDEAHRGKDPSRWEGTPQPDGTTTYKAKKNSSASVMQLSRTAVRVLEMTATPMPDRIRDIYALADVYDPGGFGKKFRTFADRYCAGHENTFGHYDSKGSSNEKELMARVDTFTSRVSKSRAHAGLPSIGRQILTLTPKEIGLRPKGAKPMKVNTAGGRAAVVEARAQVAAEAKRQFIAQRAVDYAFEDEFKVCAFTGRHDSCERLGETIRELLEPINRKRAQKAQAPIALWVSHGGIDGARERQKLVEGTIYPHPGPAILVGTMDAFSEAINGLHDTDRVLCGYLPWNLLLEQFEGRFSRLGGTRRCVIEYLVAQHTIDEAILDMILGKAADVTSIMPSEVLDGISRELSGENQKESIMEAALEKLLAADDDVTLGWKTVVEQREARVVATAIDAELLEVAEDEGEVTPEDLEDEDQ